MEFKYISLPSNEIQLELIVPINGVDVKKTGVFEKDITLSPDTFIVKCEYILLTDLLQEVSELINLHIGEENGKI